MPQQQRVIMGLMAKIEMLVGSTFSQIDDVLEDRIFDAIDSGDSARLNRMIHELEEYVDFLKDQYNPRSK